tara:strand:+ start:6170 stop:6373 length:204 start_codon:yes stop_codon:yes gene_type:complete
MLAVTPVELQRILEELRQPAIGETGYPPGGTYDDVSPVQQMAAIDAAMIEYFECLEWLRARRGGKTR